MQNELAVGITAAAAAARGAVCNFIVINIRTNDRGFIFAMFECPLMMVVLLLHVLYAQFIAAQRAITNFPLAKE